MFVSLSFGSYLPPRRHDVALMMMTTTAVAVAQAPP
jgi:hypothetical protein